MKIKNILYKTFDSLTYDETRFFFDMRDKYELNICDKYGTIHLSKDLVWIAYHYDELSDNAFQECERKNYQALSEEAFEELKEIK